MDLDSCFHRYFSLCVIFSNINKTHYIPAITDTDFFTIFSGNLHSSEQKLEYKYKLNLINQNLKGILVSAINTTGIGIFVFEVFPRLDLPRSIILMCTVYFIPSTLKLFQLKSFLIKKDSGLKKVKRISKITLYIVFTLMQYSVFFIVLFSDFESDWKIPIGLILISISSNGNFLDLIVNSYKDNKLSNVLHKIDRFKDNLKLSRHKIQVFSSLVNIGIIFLIAYIGNPKFMSNNDLFNNKLNSDEKMWYFLPFIVQTISFLVCYVSCSLSLELRMSRISFALPLSLATPISLIISTVLCQSRDEEKDKLSFKNQFMCAADYSLMPYVWQLILGVCFWWLSSLWTTSHIWSKNQKVLKISKF